MGVAEQTTDLFRLEELFAIDRPDVAKVVLIEGAAGFGKTSLMRAFAERATDWGATFLSASASHAERAMPLSTCGQLFRGSALTGPEIEQAERLLREGARAVTAPRPDGASQTPGQVPADILAGLGAILLQPAERGPLVIGVDDIQHADLASVQFLIYLAHRTKYTRVLLVLTECLQASRLYSLLHTELLRQPCALRLRLRPLSEQAVAGMLGEHIDPQAAGRLAPDCHRLTGGNPLLVRALIDDYRMAGPARPAGLVFGDAFRQAVLACLHRSEATALARGLAVLPESASAFLLGELVQFDAESTGLTRDVLRATGLVDACGLHEPVRAAVLSGMAPPERAALRLRAAELLHIHGACAAAVADLLMAADQAPAPWGVMVLRQAAEQALAEGRVEAAIAYLRLAFRESAGDERSAAVRLEVARAEWQVDPATAARHLPDLTRALREDRLPASAAGGLATWLLWFGRVEEALDLLSGQPEPDRAQSIQPIPSVHSAQPTETWPVHAGTPWWVRYAYPELVPHPFDRPPAAALVPVTPDRRAGVMLANLMAPGKHPHAVAHAERILGDAGLASVGPAQVAAIAVLVFAGELEVAERWCDSLGEPASHRPPLVEALLTALHALISERRGELDAAVSQVREAFTLVPPKSWGILAGLPLGTLILALTAAGEHAEAAKCLSVQLPDALFRSPLGLPYLRACGWYHLAIDRPQAALEEFRACGQLMTAWGLEAPGFVPWRSDMAHARLALGDRQTARRLAADQLEILPPGLPRARGLTLRVLAAASAPGERIPLLVAAVEQLERSGDRLELARACADLSESHRAAGAADLAGEPDRRARSLAAECGAATPVSPYGLQAAAEGGSEQDAGSLTGLSGAERRVAALAAEGYTNRQIAHRLHVTMSTVEQHLTRVYRKLKISRRSDLPRPE